MRALCAGGLAVTALAACMAEERAYTGGDTAIPVPAGTQVYNHGDKGADQCGTTTEAFTAIPTSEAVTAGNHRDNGRVLMYGFSPEEVELRQGHDCNSGTIWVHKNAMPEVPVI